MAATAGPRNLITDVPGILVGQAQDTGSISGAPGSRETELLAPGTLVDHVDAIVLSGGSAFGLDAAAVMDWLLEAGRGFTVGSARVPIVPAAVLFDLGFPGRLVWTGEPPYRALGRQAAAAAGKDFALGNAGAGLGATAGRLKSGLGSASLALAGGAVVGTIVAVTNRGAVVRPDCGRRWAADLALAGEIAPQPPAPDVALDPEDFSQCGAAAPGATRRSRSSPPTRHSTMAGAGVWRSWRRTVSPRAIRPSHTPFDGDTVFALSTGTGVPVEPDALTRLGSATADCLAPAVMRVVLAAEPLGGVPSWRQLWRRLA